MGAVASKRDVNPVRPHANLRIWRCCWAKHAGLSFPRTASLLAWSAGRWQARADSNCDLRFRRARPCPLDDAPVVAPPRLERGFQV
jgi:hypothetical protein